MKTFLTTCWLLLLTLTFASAQSDSTPSNDLLFKGDHIVYKGKTLALDAKHFYIDGRLTTEEADKHPYVFTSVQEAARHLTPGTSDADRMILYIAPYVYWIDDPDDPTVRISDDGREPFGLKINCPWLKIVGLSDHPEHVVLAANRGQAQGAVGNFTMFFFHGDGISLNNVTLGNYCNVDLVYPLNSALNRPKRMSSITQAQLAYADGDRLEAHNVRFISRLNTCPLNGGRRTLFDRCYFESTDDALCSTGVYLNCTFTFYGSKPFYATAKTGATLLNCDIYVKAGRRQYLTKAESQVSLIDCRYHTQDSVYLGWTQDPTPQLRCYQSGVTCNGRPVTLDAAVPDITVDITDKPLLRAYKVVNGAQTLYNTYNLLAGYDDWDPMGIKDAIRQAEQDLGCRLHGIPTSLTLESEADSIETGRAGRALRACVQRPTGYDGRMPDLQWACDTTLLSLEGDNSQKLMYGANQTDSACATVVRVTSALGLEAARVVTAVSQILPAPRFVEQPVIRQQKGRLTVAYTLDLEGRSDRSDITWYRCTSPRGDDAIPIAVSRRNRPESEYLLTKNDVGYYLMAEVAPRHIRSRAGEKVRAVSSRPITEKDVPRTYRFQTDFSDFPCRQQPRILPGFWTVDGYKPSDTAGYKWSADSVRNYYYGEGMDAARGRYGLIQITRGARLMFTPVAGTYDDMSIELQVAPCKQTAQGFGSPTGQYMDVCLKFDTRSLTGYGLRIIRTTKYHNAVDFYLVKYKNGQVTPLTEAVSGICYLPMCTIRVEAKGNRLTARVSTTAEMRPTTDPALHRSIDLSATMDEETAYGGICIQHTGSGYQSATVLCSMSVDW